MANQLDRMLDNLTDPVKKKKRKRKREQKVQEKRKKICMSGKEFARDHFNEPPTEEKQEMVRDFVRPKTLSTPELEKKIQEVDIEDIGYVKLEHKGGMACVFDFILCAGKCDKWLQQELKIVGWKKNMTNYNPISVSHSANEVQEATVECLKMACKQMIQYQKSKQISKVKK